MLKSPRLVLLALLPLLAHCASAPRLDGVQASHAIPASDTAPLDRAVLGELGADPRVSSVRLVDQNALAFAYRAASAAASERTLDVQYYAWHDDLTGKLLAAELMRAAERGVRVRVLVDDVNARAKHDVLLVADQHPNLKVRIFNPFYSRHGTLARIGEFLFNSRRLNRRMHNKAWIADNRIAIVGGRNIGDEYFGASAEANTRDLDLVMVGPIVADVSREFDEYWNSPNAVPVSRFEGRKPKPGELEALVEGARQFRDGAGTTPYIAALRDPQQRADLIAKAPPPLKVRHIELLVDDPAKVGEKADATGADTSRVLLELADKVDQATQEVLIVSPYFVPGAQGTRSLTAEVARGMHIAVLTNSLAATDVAAVHAGYARYRRELLRGGVDLYEMKPLVGSGDGKRRLSVTGSSEASLHTKAMVIDRHWVFVGSMNLDPRSAKLNTEMGVLVDSAELAEQLRGQFELDTSPEFSYRVVVEEPGHELVWYDRVDGKERRSEHEPDASVWRRMGATALRALPIESLL